MKTKNYSQHILLHATILIVLFAAYTSCTKNIDIRTDDSPEHLVIYGYITTDTTSHAVRITRSTGYFSTSKPGGISGASVSIRFDEGNIVLEESLEETGLYLTPPNISGVAGKTYTLNVVLDFDNDDETEEYEATSRLPLPIRLDSIGTRKSKMLFNDFIDILVWGRLTQEGVSYSNDFSFHVFRNGIPLNDSLQGYSVISSEFLAIEEVTALPVFRLNQEDKNNQLATGDVITLQAESITREYATFIDHAQREAGGSIPIFDGPPANVKTNIRCISGSSKANISGFFTAFSKNSRTLIYRD